MPIARDLLKPITLNIPEIRLKLDREKERQRYYHDRHSSQDLPALQEGDPVSMSPLPGTKEWLPATVVHKHASPRSYVVQCRGQKYRRNRKDLRISTHKSNVGAEQLLPRQATNKPTHTRTNETSFSAAPPQVPTNSNSANPQIPYRRVSTEEPKTASLTQPKPVSTGTGASGDNQPPATISNSPVKTRGGRVSRRPKYLQDYCT